MPNQTSIIINSELDVHRWYAVHTLQYADGRIETQVIGTLPDGGGIALFDSVEEWDAWDE